MKPCQPDEHVIKEYDGLYRCMICYEVYVPASQCAECDCAKVDEQLDVIQGNDNEQSTETT
jgi:hypothetical protein